MAPPPVLLATALAALLAARGAEARGPRVEVPGLGALQGKYASAFSSEVSMFLGVPYAEAPVGALRWMPPRPYGAWGGLRDAAEFQDACMGGLLPGQHANTSEDCLFLNVAARTSGLGGVPNQTVMMWMYGGGFNFGMSQDPEYNISSLVSAASLPVVVVSLNYRMNTFGFLGSRALAARSPDGSTGNYGIQDQRLALMWVRDHISVFGGRADDVTIFGQSAGGGSVLHHLIYPASYGLYSKAIIESGTFDVDLPLADAEAMCDEIIRHAGCGTDLGCLLNKSAKEVELAAGTVMTYSKLRDVHWGPVLDGVSIRGTAQELIAAGNFNSNAKVIVGSNRDEYAFIIPYFPDQDSAFSPQMTETQFDHIYAYLGAENLKTLKRVYDPSVYRYPADLGNKSQWWWTAMRVATDNGLPNKWVPEGSPFGRYPKGIAFGHCSARRVADLLVRGGAPAVYMYNFARNSGDDAGSDTVEHGDDVDFVFHDQANLGSSSGNEALSRAVVAYWTSFAARGEPSAGGGEQVAWPRYLPDKDQANLRFGATSFSADITVDYAFRKPACDFLDTLAPERPSGPIVIYL